MQKAMNQSIDHDDSTANRQRTNFSNDSWRQTLFCLLGVEHSGQVVKLKTADFGLAGEPQRDLLDRRNRDLSLGSAVVPGVLSDDSTGGLRDQ